MQQRLVEQEEKGRTREGSRREGHGVGGTKERKIHPHASSMGPFPFPVTLPLFLLALLPSCPAFQPCSFARLLARSLFLAVFLSLSLARIRGVQTGFAIKRIPSRNARDQREDLTNTFKLDLGLSTSRSVFSFSFLFLPLTPCSPRRRASSLSLSFSLYVPRYFSLRLSRAASLSRVIRCPSRLFARVKGTWKEGMTKPASRCEKGASTIVVDHIAER